MPRYFAPEERYNKFKAWREQRNLDAAGQGPQAPADPVWQSVARNVSTGPAPVLPPAPQPTPMPPPQLSVPENWQGPLRQSVSEMRPPSGALVADSMGVSGPPRKPLWFLNADNPRDLPGVQGATDWMGDAWQAVASRLPRPQPVPEETLPTTPPEMPAGVWPPVQQYPAPQPVVPPSSQPQPPSLPPTPLELAGSGLQWGQRNVDWPSLEAAQQSKEVTGLPGTVTAGGLTGGNLVQAAILGAEKQGGVVPWLQSLGPSWEQRPEEYPGQKGLVELLGPSQLALNAVGPGEIGAAGKAIGGAAKKSARAVDRAVTSPEGQAIARRLLPAGTIEDVSKATPDAPTFYSQLERAVASPKAPNRAPAEQWRGILNAQGVKSDELRWTGVDDLLSERAGRPVTRQELQAALDQNRVNVQEVTKGGPPVVDWQPTSDGALYAREHEMSIEPLANGLYRFSDRSSGLSNTVGTLDEAKAMGQSMAERTAEANPSTKFGQYQLPGGENYRELLMTLPEQKLTQEPFGVMFTGRVWKITENGNPLNMREFPTQEAAEYTARNYNENAQSTLRESTSYTSSHWSEPNVLAHVRFNDRTAPDGKKVLFIEEVQSDWHQTGRQRGYSDPAAAEAVSHEHSALLTQLHERYGTTRLTDLKKYLTPEDEAAIAKLNERYAAVSSGPPAAPFSKAWPELALKRMIRWASENGYDRIAWTTGKQQAERYDLAKQVESIAWKPKTGELQGQRIGAMGSETLATDVTPEKLPDYVGKEVAAKLLQQSPNDFGWQELSGLDLSVGGEGMQGFYDRILPETANKLGKKFGARVSTTNISESPPSWSRAPGVDPRAYARTTVHSLDITPALKAAAMKEGFPLFVPPEIGGAVAGGAYGAVQPAESEQEWAQNIVKFAGGGTVLASGARAAGKVLASRGAKGPFGERLGLQADADRFLANTERRQAEIEARLAEIEPKLEAGFGAQAARSELRDMGGTIQRPPRAGSLTNAQLEEIAAEHGVSPYVNSWWEALDDEAFKERGPGQRSGKWQAPKAPDKVELAALNKEYAALRAEQARLNQGFEAGYQAAYDLPAASSAESSLSAPPSSGRTPLSGGETPLRPSGNPPETIVPPAEQGGASTLRGNAKATTSPKKLPPEIEQPIQQGAQQELQGQGQPGGSNIPDSALAQQAKETLERAKGTPEQAAELRPPEEGYAGNVNLAKQTEPAQVGIAQTLADAGFNEFAGQRRGVQHDADALVKAQEIAQQRTTEDWLAIRPGTILNQEERLALDNTMDKSWQERGQMIQERLALQAEGRSTVELDARIGLKLLEGQALTAVSTGVRSEAGRLLRSYTKVISGEFGSGTRAIQKAHEILGGTDRFEKWLDEFQAIPANDVVGQYRMMQKLAQPTKADMFNAWRYASMLSSWKTHEVNFISNAGQSAVRPLTTALAGYPREAAADIYGMIQGIPEGVRAFGQALSTGIPKYGVSQIENARPRPLGQGKLGRAIALPSDLLVAADDFWKAVNESGALHTEAYRLAKGDAVKAEELLRNPTEAMVARAQTAARYATYQNDPNALVTRFINVANTPGAWGAIVRIFAPFIRTPANIYVRGLGMTLQPLVGPVKIGIKAAKGDMRAVRMEAAKTLLSGTVLAGLWGMAQGGNLTGQGPTDPAKRRILEESGWQSNSIKVGDRWVKYSNFGPISIPMAAVAAVKEGLDEGQKPNRELIGTAVDRVYNSMLDVSFVQGLSDVLRGEGITGRMAQVGGSFLGSMVPYGSGLAAVERIVDPTVRAKDSPLDYVQGRIPIASGRLAPEPSIYGGTRQQGAGDLAAQILLPWQTGTQRQDPVATEAARLNQSPEARQAGVAVTVRQFGDQYAGAKQTPEQRRLLQTTAGQYAATYIADMISRADYQRLADPQKVATLNKALGTAYEIADLKLGNQVARDDRHRALLAWASVPQYEGVKGSPEQIAQQNYEIAQAKARLVEYRKELGADAGEVKLLKEDKHAFALALRSRIDSDLLKIKKARLDKEFGGALTQAEKEGLVGAGNTVLPVGGGR